MIVVLGPRRYDISHRALVMGILNRTPDSFYDRGAFWDFDAFLARAEQLVADGADFLDVGGVKAGPGPEVTEAEELDRVVPAVEALVARFDLPVSVDTFRGSVARASYRAGAVVGNDISGFADPDFLLAAVEAGASVVATHVRLAPRVPDPTPPYEDVSAAVCTFLADRAARALAAGMPRERVMIDAGLDLGKTRPSRPSCSSGRPTSSTSGSRSSCRPRTSASSASWWAPRSTTAGRRPSPPTPSASASAVGSCGPTTWPAPDGSPT